MTKLHSELSIAIDGPAGAGKGTLARLLSEKYNLLHIESGLLYRAIGYLSTKNNVDPFDKLSLLELIQDSQFFYSRNNVEDHSVSRLLINREDVTNKLRTPKIDIIVPIIARIPEVRNSIQTILMDLAKQKYIVMDGKDIGTRIMPDAFIKFYLYADFFCRVNRRFLQYQGMGVRISLKLVGEEIHNRDSLDINRAIDPLKPAYDAIYIDNTSLTIAETFSAASHFIETRSLLGNN